MFLSLLLLTQILFHGPVFSTVYDGAGPAVLYQRPQGSLKLRCTYPPQSNALDQNYHGSLLRITKPD
jgi:hypothetical protein